VVRSQAGRQVVRFSGVSIYKSWSSDWLSTRLASTNEIDQRNQKTVDFYMVLDKDAEVSVQGGEYDTAPCSVGTRM
jgi:hypothetical protein